MKLIGCARRPEWLRHFVYHAPMFHDMKYFYFCDRKYFFILRDIYLKVYMKIFLINIDI